MRVERSAIYKFCEAEYNLPFTDLYIFDEFVISQVKAGYKYTQSDAIRLVGAITKHFPNNAPFDFISNRVNDFSLDPNDLRWFLSLLDNIRSYSVAYYDSPSKANYTLESQFSPIPVNAFPNLVLALEALYASSKKSFK